MKSSPRSAACAPPALVSLAVASFLCSPAHAIAQAATAPARHASLKQEIALAYDRGLGFLTRAQNPESGQWGDAEPVAITGLAAAAYLMQPGRAPDAPVSPNIERALRFLAANAREDGGIYIQARANYNTALALMALLLHPLPEIEEIMLQARRFLVSRQLDLDEPGQNDNPLDGGIGYGDDKGMHADLSNTHFVLEALHHAEVLLADKGDTARNEPRLNFAAAIDFIQRCQNRPESNKSSWVSTDPKDAGGFVYGPGETRGEEVPQADGRVALRSYGSISYAGLLSFIYAGLDRDDPRVSAAIDWLTKNYTLEENPGLGHQGRFYYFHTMAKALNAAGVDFLETEAGKAIDWRKELGEKLLDIQKADGSWVNDGSGRWMEGDPVLTTGYILLALARLHNSL
jgi:squalene-hopene/tetraprenyl-beta-curcumene cyclase